MPQSKWLERWPLSWIKGNALWDLLKWGVGVLLTGAGGTNLLNRLNLVTFLSIASLALGLFVLASLAFKRSERIDVNAVKNEALRKLFLRDATELKRALEDVYDLYENDPSCTDKLLYPLSVSALPPEEIKDWRHKELLRFRHAYRHHIETVKRELPEFKTQLLGAGFPAESVNYRNTIRMIEDHIGALSSKVQSL